MTVLELLSRLKDVDKDMEVYLKSRDEEIDGGLQDIHAYGGTVNLCSNYNDSHGRTVGWLINDLLENFLPDEDVVLYWSWGIRKNANFAKVRENFITVNRGIIEKETFVIYN